MANLGGFVVQPYWLHVQIARKAHCRATSRQQSGLAFVEGQGRRHSEAHGYALELARAFSDGSDTDKTIIATCVMVVRIYEIWDSEVNSYRRRHRQNCRGLGKSFGRVLQQTFKTKYAEQRLFKMSPNLHLLDHLCERVAIAYGNPRYYWTYADEDLAGHMIGIEEACHPKTLAITFKIQWAPKWDPK